jgi:hypothetical protein
MVIFLQLTHQPSFMLAATAAKISEVHFVFLGTEMVLGVSDFASFHLHIDRVN